MIGTSETVKRALERRGLIAVCPEFIDAAATKLDVLAGSLDSLPEDVVETCILQVADARAGDFLPDFRRLIPASLADAPPTRACGIALAFRFFKTSPPEGEFSSTVEVEVNERFRLKTLEPLCRCHLKKRRSFGIGLEELRDDAFGHLGLLKPAQFFDPRQAKFPAWLVHFVVQPAFSELRRRAIGVRTLKPTSALSPINGITRYRLVQQLDHDVPDAHDSFTRLDEQDEAQKLTAVIDAMGELDRQILTLRGIEKKPYQEVSALLGISVDAATHRFVRAIKHLKEEFAHAAE